MPDRQPNLLFFSIDTLRYDAPGAQPETCHLAAVGETKREYTPTLDGWIDRSAFFSAASSVSTYTTSSHASLLTGLYPPRHGLRAFLRNTIHAETRTLPEVLMESGYRCILLTDTLRLFSYTGLTRGFTDIVTSDEAFRQLLEEPDDRPIFALVHVFDVHLPYLYCFDPATPDENDDFFETFDALARRHHLTSKVTRWGDQATTFARYRDYLQGICALEESSPIQLDLYLRGARKFDQGRFRRLLQLLERADFFDDALFAGFSDHGEGFYPGAPMMGHAGALTEETSRIPLFIWHSDGSTRRTIRQPVSLVDLMPTALDFAGVSDPAGTALDGRSLLGATAGARLPRRTLYQEVWVDDGIPLGPPKPPEHAPSEAERVQRHAEASVALFQRALITDRWKLTLTGHDAPEYEPALAAARSPEEFARVCYRMVLGRIEDAGGLAAMLENLHATGDTAEARAAHVAAMCASEELATWGRYHLFDHRRDPRGARPIPLRERGVRGRAHQRLVAELMSRSRLDAPEAPPVFAGTDAEHAALGDMLAGLGYADDAS